MIKIEISSKKQNPFLLTTKGKTDFLTKKLKLTIHKDYNPNKALLAR
jgi:hypothetical protein